MNSNKRTFSRHKTYKKGVKTAWRWHSLRSDKAKDNKTRSTHTHPHTLTDIETETLTVKSTANKTFDSFSEFFFPPSITYRLAFYPLRFAVIVEINEKQHYKNYIYLMVWCFDMNTICCCCCCLVVNFFCRYYFHFASALAGCLIFGICACVRVIFAMMSILCQTNMKCY